MSAACADAGRISLSEWNKKQEDRIRTLEIQLNAVTALWKESQHSLARIQEEVSRLSSKVLQYDMDIPRLQETVGASVSRRRGREKDGRVPGMGNYVTPKDVTSETPKEIVDSLNEIFLEKTLTSARE